MQDNFGQSYKECASLMDKIKDIGIDESNLLLLENHEKTQAYVKQYNPERGFGFIKDGDLELFFHFSNFTGKPEVGANIEYEIADGKKGKQAVKIRVI